MKVITTEKNIIKMWLDDIEDGALQQAKDLANLPFIFKHIAIMPDSHQGYGMPIGGVMATDNVIIPNAVGVDIGCGMIAIKLDISEIDKHLLSKVVEKIYKHIPVGFNHNEEKSHWSGFDVAPDIEVIQEQLEKSKYQLGTLGGGNHFIEIQKGDDGHIWVMIHSGSRNFGLQIAKEYHKKAVELCEKWHSDIPNKDLSFLPIESPMGKEYFDAMNFALDFAKESRRSMMERVVRIINYIMGDVEVDNVIDIHHNYASFENHFKKNVIVHRKGAVKVRKGETGIIPGSMGTNSYIVEGLDNDQSFNSCSHGAGRKMGRKQAKRELNLDNELKIMDGIISPLDQDRLDESPSAYKNIDTVMENQKDLVKIKVKLTPLAVIKS